MIRKYEKLRKIGEINKIKKIWCEIY